MKIRPLKKHESQLWHALEHFCIESRQYGGYPILVEQSLNLDVFGDIFDKEELDNGQVKIKLKKGKQFNDLHVIQLLKDE